MRAAAAVVATSHATAAGVAALHGRDDVAVVPPGVDAAPAATASEAGTRLLCVAAVTPRKGHDVLLDALARLAANPWALVLAGPPGRDAAFAAAMRDRAAAHGLTERVRFAGPLAGTALDAAYADADLLVLASRAEPYGMVVTEALARGIPVVASRVDGVPEALGTGPDGTTPGLLVPPGDSAALALALDAWLSDAALRRRLRAAAHARRARLTGWDETARELTRVIEGTRRLR